MNTEVQLMVAELFDKASSLGINEMSLFYHLKKYVNFPVEEGWNIVENHLKEYGLGDFERYPQPYGYMLYARTEELGEDGPRFKIDIVDNEPFSVSISLYDNYYSPKMTDICYDLDCSPSYIEWAYFAQQLKQRNILTLEDFNKLSDEDIEDILEGSVCENDNWESQELESKSTTVNEVDLIWPFLKETTSDMLTYYNSLDYFNFDVKDYIPIAKGKARTYYLDNTSFGEAAYIESDDCDE